jgi:hypothetical protein
MRGNAAEATFLRSSVYDQLLWLNVRVESDRSGTGRTRGPDGVIDSPVTRVSHARGDLLLCFPTFTTMESATPKKFKSNVLAALDVKPNLGDPENYHLLLTQTKRKQTPGSPDPRQPKRPAASFRPNIPGLENIPCGYPSIFGPTRISSHSPIQSPRYCSHRHQRQVYRRTTAKSLA